MPAAARGAHLIGFPKFRHANEQSGVFVFDGTPAGEKEFKEMDSGVGTWITQQRKYKKLTMIQENGYIAAKRHEYEDESIDRLVYIIGERNHARHAKKEHDKKCSKSMKELKGELKLNTAAVEKRVEKESIIVDKARAAWIARKAREMNLSNHRKHINHKPNTIGHQTSASSSGMMISNKIPSSQKLSNEQERSYMRFLKEGPNRGDGCFKESKEEQSCRVMGRTFERSRRHKVIASAFSEK